MINGMLKPAPPPLVEVTAGLDKPPETTQAHTSLSPLRLHFLGPPSIRMAQSTPFRIYDHNSHYHMNTCQSILDEPRIRDAQDELGPS